MRVGKKGQGQDVGRKLHNVRHGHGPRRGCNAVEKAAETRVRQAGKREAAVAYEDIYNGAKEAELEALANGATAAEAYQVWVRVTNENCRKRREAQDRVRAETRQARREADEILYAGVTGPDDPRYLWAMAVYEDFDRRLHEC